MKIELTDNEAEAFLILRRMFYEASTPPCDFMYWVADRLSTQYGDPPQADFIQRLREYGDRMYKMQHLLEIRK